MEAKSTGILRILPSREVKTNLKTKENEIFIQSTESRNYKFDKIFAKNTENSDVWESLCRGKYSLTEFLSSGISCAVITYGEVNSGKTFSLFGKENSLDMFSMIFSDLFLQFEKPLGLSIWEIVYVASERNEQVIDLLKISDFKPLPHLFTQDFITVQVENVREAEYVFECAKELSANWKSKSEGGFRSINNRSHLFIRITIEKNHLYIVDLAGSLPSILSPEIRVKLGSDEQLNYTRTGLNQYRSIVWEMSKNANVTVESLLTSRKSKLASIIAPIIASGKNYFFTPIKEDSSYEDIIKNLEVLNRSQNIRVFPKVLNVESKVIPLNVFLQRHKVAKYWEFKYPECEDKEIGEDQGENKQFSRISLKEQISLMIQELEEPAKKEPKDLLFNHSPNEVLMPDKETVSFKEKDFDSFEHQDPYVETEIQEQKTMHELEIQNLKLENCALRQKLRTIQENSAFIGIFNLYEDEIRKLELQIKTLREEFINNINIIEKTIEISESADEIGILNQKHKQSLKSLSNHIKTLEARITEKEKENSELKKNERKWQLSRKCFENISRKSLELENVVGKQSKYLNSNKNTFAEMIEELERLHKENEILRLEKQETIEVNEKILKYYKLDKAL